MEIFSLKDWIYTYFYSILVSRSTFVLENTKNNTHTFNSIFKTGDYLQSRNGILKLQLNSNGNLVIHCNYKQIWSSNTSSNSIKSLHFGKNNTQSLGKKRNRSTWEAELSRKNLYHKYFVLQDDGNLVISDKCGKILWESKTSGICNVIPGM